MLVPPRESNTSAAEAPSRVEQKNTLTVKDAGRNRLAMAEKYLAAAARRTPPRAATWRTVLTLPDCSQCGFLTCPQGVLRARRSFGWDWRGRRWGIPNFRQ